MNLPVRLRTMRLPLYASLLCLICCFIHTSKFLSFKLDQWCLYVPDLASTLCASSWWCVKEIYIVQFLLEEFNGPNICPELYSDSTGCKVMGDGGRGGGGNYLQNVGHISLLCAYCSQRTLTVDSTSYFSPDINSFSASITCCVLIVAVAHFIRLAFEWSCVFCAVHLLALREVVQPMRRE